MNIATLIKNLSKEQKVDSTQRSKQKENLASKEDTISIKDQGQQAELDITLTTTTRSLGMSMALFKKRSSSLATKKPNHMELS